MPKLRVYLNFAGRAEEAFTFYRSVFGGTFSSDIRFRDMPMEGVTIPKGDENRIMHMSLPVGREDVLMAGDALESPGQKVIRGNNVYIFVDPDSNLEADRIFSALAAGGSIEMPMADRPWGDYYGSLKDRYGVMWMVNCAYPKGQ